MRVTLVSTSVITIDRISPFVVSPLDLTFGNTAVMKKWASVSPKQSVRYTDLSHVCQSACLTSALEVRQWVKLVRHAEIKVNGALVQMAAKKDLQSGSAAASQHIIKQSHLPTSQRAPVQRRLPAPPALRNGSHQHADDSIPLLLGWVTQLVSMSDCR